MFVRLAMIEDAERIVEMARANRDETMPPDEPFDPDLVRETFARYLATANPTFFVVERQRRVVGFLQAVIGTYDYRTGFYTTQRVIYVEPANRGTRAAVLLMKELLAWSKRLGAAEILGGVDNGFRADRTRDFLAHFGFEVVGYAMRKRL